MEKRENKSNTLKWIYEYAKESLWRILLLTVLSGMMAGSFILLALVSSRLLDIATGSREGSIGREVFFLILLIALQALLNILNSNLRVRATTKIEMQIRKGLFASILKKQYQDVMHIHSGEIMNRMTSDIDIVVSGVVSLLPQTISLFTKLAAGLAVLFSIDARFTLIVLAVGLAVCAFIRIFSKRFKYMHKEMQRTNGVVRSYLQECIENLIVIKSFANEEAVCDKLDEFQKDNYRIRILKNAVNNLANTMIYVLFTAGYYAALVWGALQLSAGQITFGTLTAFLQIIQQIKAPFRNMSGLIPQYYNMLASAERLQELEDMPDERERGRIADPKAFYEDFLALSAQDVTFSYDEHVILEHASLRVEKGELVALVGESGIGKSTMMKLFLHLMPCETGELYLETKNSRRKIDAGTRNIFSYVPQGNMIMSGTIRDNITFCSQAASDESIRKAAEAACIWEYISSLPNGLDTVLAERGQGLSEGQIQRLAIARAVLNDAPILLLDECTSSLDKETEWKVLQNIKRMNTKTILCISHTEAGVACCDRVMRIENRRFVEVNVRE